MGPTRPTKPIASTNDAPFRVLLRGTEFQTRVWQALLTIPPGKLTSYNDIAKRLGYKNGAAQAVGRAAASNMISYLVPCHRVIRKTGALGGYRWDNARKLAMIGWEAAQAEQAA